MKLLRWRSDTIVKSLLFCRVATIVFSSCCLVILITFFLCANFKWQLLSDGSDIAKIEIISNLLRQLVLIRGTNIFASDGQRWRALSLRWDNDVESDIEKLTHWTPKPKKTQKTATYGVASRDNGLVHAVKCGGLLRLMRICYGISFIELRSFITTYWSNEKLKIPHGWNSSNIW